MAKREVEKEHKKLDKETAKKWFHKFIDYLRHFVIIFMVFFMLNMAMKYLNGVEDFNPFDFSRYNAYYWSTFIIWFALYLIFKGITGRTKLSLLIILALEYIFDMINATVINVRGAAISISDVGAIPTAASVARTIEFPWTTSITIATCAVIIAILIIIVFRNQLLSLKGGVKVRILKVVIGVGAFIVLASTSVYKDDSLWNLNERYYDSGTPITILRLLQNYKVEAPKGYDKDKVKDLLAKYETSGNTDSTTDVPNIIVIANESFSDYYNTYNTGYDDPIPFYNSLAKQEGTISGITYSSTFGGETANVEFEFFTQNSLKVLPIGAFPFQQYISRDVKGSLPNVLRNQGYTTFAYHPWLTYAYSRNKVYKYLGFDEAYYLEQIGMENLEENFNSEYPSDSSLYRYIIDKMEDKPSNQKIFEYILTMQNHISYRFPSEEMQTYHEDLDRNVYMQLLHASDDALKEFVEYLEKQDEKYILMIFGDHQPRLGILDNTDGKQYEVPFLIWANYQLPTQHNIVTSTVYLQNYLIEAAGLKPTAMNNYMKELSKEIPVLTKNFFMDKDYKYYDNSIEKQSRFTKLDEYDRICYYRIFDENKEK